MNVTKLVILVFFIIFVGSAIYLIYPKLQPLIAARRGQTAPTPTVTVSPPDTSSQPTPFPTPTISENPQMNQLQTTLKTSIKTYLERNIGLSSLAGTLHCAYEPLQASQNGNRLTGYIWVYCQEYTTTNGQRQKGTGFTVPMSLEISLTGTPQVLSHRIPRAGTFYDTDVRTIFPASLTVTQIFDHSSPNFKDTARRLMTEIESSL